MHTPGPWTWHPLVGDDGGPLRGEALVNYVADCIRAGGVRDFYFVSAVLADGRAADVCHTGNGPTSPANAGLISAAPDMYEALEAYGAFASHVGACPSCGGSTLCADASDLLDKANKLHYRAWAKAKGRE